MFKKFILISALIALLTGNLYAQSIILQQSGGGLSASSTNTFTNKTYDAEATGNVITIPFKVQLPFAGCDNATAVAVWDLPASNAATASCFTGPTNTQKGAMAFADGNFAETTYLLPSDWTGVIDARLVLTGGGSDTSGTIIPTIATGCAAVDGSATNDPAYNTADTLTTITLATAANRMWASTKSSITTTGCVAGSMMHIRMGRATDTASSAARYYILELTIRRAM